METNTNTQKKFELDDCMKSFSQKLIDASIKTVESMIKTTDVMNITGFEEMFLVRNGTNYTELEKEESEDKVTLLGYITLKMIGHPNKKARFAIWQRLSASKILI